ncbi:Anti-sigma-K factor rskA [Botrimarina colliarenosi]|uniref:Anti-sigma-K factor rskA n=1 Tax=Botrimarina colliarenosi TaxID=2528001 RepID=A0A5C6AMR1_9BACT|nr:anti-sigma factor [Botrimarina colliarenosi]TWU00416.1 Anti-sigma-K factor rskA [Botrimarina colliarenosi]
MNATPASGGPSPHDAQRLDELLADRALWGLDAAETAELERLLAGSADADEGYDLVATTLAAAGASESLPPLLRERLLDDAAEFDFAAARGGSAVTPVTPRRAEWPVYTMLAIAAGLLLSFWMGRPAPSPLDNRQALVASADDLVEVAWAPQDDPSLEELPEEAAYGDVVWSDAAQQGYMRFRGLKANDPAVEQYQLWVFDAERDERYPVDGGVFNIPAGEGEHVVPIRTTLPVTKATLFAITVEKPGGVVVSDRSRLPLLASR